MPSTDRRRRLGLLVLIAGLVVAALPLWSSAPSERELVVRLAAQADALEVRWLDGDEVVWGARVHGGAAEMRRTLRLPAGRYRLEARVTDDGVTRDIARDIDVAEGASQVLVSLP